MYPYVPRSVPRCQGNQLPPGISSLEGLKYQWGRRFSIGVVWHPNGSPNHPDIVRTGVRLAAMTEPASKASRRQRLEMRVTPQQDAVIRQAARLENTTVTAFVLDTVTARAHKVIRKHADLVLSNAAFDRFIAELDKPAQVVPQLAKLFERNPKLPEG